MSKVILDAAGASLPDKPSALIRAALSDMSGLDPRQYRPSARCRYKRDADTDLIFVDIADAEHELDANASNWRLIAAEKWELEEPLEHSGYEGWTQWREFEKDMRRMADVLEQAGE